MAFRHFRCDHCGRINRIPDEGVARGPSSAEGRGEPLPGRPSPICGNCKQRLDTSGHPLHLTDDELADLVAKSPVPVVVDFYADWCGPCRAIAPSLETIAKESAGNVFVAKIDTQRHQRTANQLGVSGIPALFVYKDGRVVDKQAGALPLPALRRWIAPHVGTPAAG